MRVFSQIHNCQQKKKQQQKQQKQKQSNKQDKNGGGGAALLGLAKCIHYYFCPCVQRVCVSQINISRGK